MSGGAASWVTTIKTPFGVGGVCDSAHGTADSVGHSSRARKVFLSKNGPIGNCGHDRADLRALRVRSSPDSGRSFVNPAVPAVPMQVVYLRDSPARIRRILRAVVQRDRRICIARSRSGGEATLAASFDERIEPFCDQRSIRPADRIEKRCANNLRAPSQAAARSQDHRMAAFGCNFARRTSRANRSRVRSADAACHCALEPAWRCGDVALADSMGCPTPVRVDAAVGPV